MDIKDKIILLVEDNEEDEILTVRALEMNKIRNEVVVVRDGAAAIDYLFGQGAYAGRDVTVQPQVVLLDLKLPKIDGLEVLKAIRANEHTRRLPVVILTTSSEDRDVNQGYDYGANAYVRKPVDFMEFAEAVKNLGLFWLVINQKARDE
jgi:two-component system response regulator